MKHFTFSPDISSKIVTPKNNRISLYVNKYIKSVLCLLSTSLNESANFGAIMSIL